MIQIVQTIKVDLIRERIYAGNKEFIGTYKIGTNHPIPFRLIQDRETNEIIFEPQIQLVLRGHYDIIKEEVLKQSATI